MRVLAIVKRILIQTVRDKRTLALMMVAPLVLLTLVNFLFNESNDSKLKVGVYETKQEFNSELEDNDIEIVEYKDNKNIEEKIKEDKLKAFISEENEKIYITYENSSPLDTSKIKGTVQGTLVKSEVNNFKEVAEKMKVKGLESDKSISIEDSYVYGDGDLTFFDTISPILVGFFVFFFVFLISGISLLKERTSKTLEKLLATSIKRWEIIVGYLLGYGLFAIIQTIIVVCFSIYVLGIRMEGNIMLVLITNIIIAFVALSLGILLSTFANSEFQMMQFIPIVVVPQIFFAGLIPVDTMATWLQKIAHVMPLYYGADALQGIMIKSYGFADIQIDLGVLFVFLIVFYILNVLGLKRYRKV